MSEEYITIEHVVDRSLVRAGRCVGTYSRVFLYSGDLRKADRCVVGWS